MSVLLKYVEDVLTPTESQTKFLKSKIRSIRKILTNNASLAPKEVHTGGSLEKGTMLRYHLDGDVICIYNNEAEIGKNWRKLMLAVHKDLQANFPTIEVEEAGNLAIHVKTELEKQEANIDVVPCYYVNSPKVMNDHTQSKLYAGITTVWHGRFIVRYKNLPYFTTIVRLLKDWKHEHDIPELKGLHMELITADVYNNVIEDIENIKDLDEVFFYCLEEIISILDGYPLIPANWKYCSEGSYKEQYDFPVIIDPANPHDNLLKKLIPEDRKKIRRKVIKTMENINQSNYADIFNAKHRTKFFDT